MLLVNTKASYPLAARALVEKGADPSALAHLAEVTAGDWPPLTEGVLRSWADYVLGTCEGIVTVAYTVETWHQVVSHGVPKVRFVVEPARELAYMIGTPQPHGPWRRGESRGTRRFESAPFLGGSRREHGTDGWEAAVVATARAILGVREVEAGPTMTVRPDGTVVVTVDAGTNVLVVSRTA